MNPTRDDFAQLDDVSFEMCVRILENYQSTRKFLEHWIGAFGDDAFKNPAVYDAIAYGYSKMKSNDAKIKRSILEQMKAQNCGSEDANNGETHN